MVTGSIAIAQRSGIVRMVHPRTNLTLAPDLHFGTMWRARTVLSLRSVVLSLSAPSSPEVIASTVEGAPEEWHGFLVSCFVFLYTSLCVSGFIGGSLRLDLEEEKEDTSLIFLYSNFGGGGIHWSEYYYSVIQIVCFSSNLLLIS